MPPPRPPRLVDEFFWGSRGQVRFWGAVMLAVLGGWLRASAHVEPNPAKGLDEDYMQRYADPYGGLPPADAGAGAFRAPAGWNYHVLFLTLATSLCATEAGFSWSSPALLTTYRVKLAHHVAANVLALAFTAAGVVAIAQAKQGEGEPHVFSPHAWCGVLVMALGALNAAGGLLAFVLLKGRLSPGAFVRASIAHTIAGRLFIVGMLGVAAMGWMDYQMMLVMGAQGYYASASVLEAFAGVVIFIQAGFLFVYFTTKDITIPPIPEPAHKSVVTVAPAAGAVV